MADARSPAVPAPRAECAVSESAGRLITGSSVREGTDRPSKTRASNCQQQFGPAFTQSDCCEALPAWLARRPPAARCRARPRRWPQGSTGIRRYRTGVNNDRLPAETEPPISEGLRQRGIDILQELLADGKVDLDRFRAALDGLLGARTHADFASVVRSLPPPVAFTAAARRRQEPLKVSASIEDVRLKGRWQVGRHAQDVTAPDLRSPLGWFQDAPLVAGRTRPLDPGCAGCAGCHPRGPRRAVLDIGLLAPHHLLAGQTAGPPKAAVLASLAKRDCPRADPAIWGSGARLRAVAFTCEVAWRFGGWPRWRRHRRVARRRR